MEFILWGTKKGSPDWMEEVIAETNNVEQLEDAKKRAIENDFMNLRTMNYNGEQPDFIGAINK